MRALGYWVVDRVVGHLEGIAESPAVVTGTPDELRAALGGPPPEDPGDPAAALRTLADVALAHMQHGEHPRNFARVPGPSSYAGVLGEWLATGFNAIAASWTGGSGPATVELVVIDWLRQLLGLPDTTEGILVSGGSLASVTALVVARNEVGAGTVYLSDQTHSSIVRGLFALGFPGSDVRVLTSDGRQRLSVEALREALDADRTAGRRPAIVIANAGTTNTGAVDPLPELAGICAAEGLWLHVDGAYGAPAALCDAGRRLLAGIERADSLVLDPHKWLFQPYDLGCLLVRRHGALERAFRTTPDYLADVTGVDDEVDLRDRGLELSRRGRGVKLWLTFRTYGVVRIRAAIAHGIGLAERAERLVAADPDWRVVTPAQLGIVTFTLRRPAAGRDAYDELAARAAGVAADGSAHLTTTRVSGTPVLRLCTINPRTTPDDITQTLAGLGVGSCIRRGAAG